jgi:hypothetical protein
MQILLGVKDANFITENRAGGYLWTPTVLLIASFNETTFIGAGQEKIVFVEYIWIFERRKQIHCIRLCPHFSTINYKIPLWVQIKV